MKVIFTGVLALLLALAAMGPAIHADELATRNTMSFEALGRGLLYSVNYDRAVSDRFSVGVGYSSFDAGIVQVTVLPLYMDYYFYNSELKSHRWFASGGADIVHASLSFWGVSFGGTGALPTVGAGYEYRSASGFLVRAAVYGIVGDST